MYGQNNYQQQGYGYQPQQGYPPQAQGYPPQQAPQPAVQMSAAEMLDQISRQSSKSAHFEQPGDRVSGIIENVTASQVRDYTTKEPQFWKDGSPCLQVVVTIDTGITDPNVEDDDGRRTVYIKGWGVQRRAWLNALRNAGLKKASEIKPGDHFTATFTGYGERNANRQPAKLFEYVIEHQSPADLAMNPPQNMPQPAPYAPTPTQPSFGYPQQAPMSQNPNLSTPAQAATPAAPRVDEQQVLQMHAAGKSVPEIQTMTGFLATDIQRVILQARPHGGSEQEPEF
ncbi:hypothetical protein D2E25_0268 [Bifidobacterium goeldii]|uniref:Uncharacterized protein n=1 Tax=Bifidobacterium goeldii TaxID=2306975 RepID=A0A430FMK1_9BIFI|nr:hypothetical protein [Bifidobacterium goeldii]RSX53962.1 hypothetical protein D2E25_0268 [Bifidobacterium goeldii]